MVTIRETANEGIGSIGRETWQNVDGSVVATTTTDEKLWRDYISGAAVDTTKWTVTQVTGTGITTSVASGGLTVNMGTTNGDELWLTSTATFAMPFRTLVTATMNQRIAGNLMYFEMVSVDPSTGLIDERNAAAWRFEGTTNTQALYEVQCDGLPRLTSGVSTINSTAGTILYEIEPSLSEVGFHTRTSDNVNARVNSYVRHSQIPDYNQRYRLRLRFKNTATPATATTISFYVLTVHDYKMLAVEAVGGRASAAPGQSTAVQIAGAPTGASSIAVQGIGSNVSSGKEVPVALALSALPTTYTSARAVAITSTLVGAAITKPYSIPEQDWVYAALTGGIVNTTDVPLKAAVASIRNYVTAVSLINTAATATEFVLKDGATIVWRTMLPASMTVAQVYTFPTPLKTTVNTALNAACITTAAAVYINAQGYAAP